MNIQNRINFIRFKCPSIYIYFIYVRLLTLQDIHLIFFHLYLGLPDLQSSIVVYIYLVNVWAEEGSIFMRYEKYPKNQVKSKNKKKPIR